MQRTATHIDSKHTKNSNTNRTKLNVYKYYCVNNIIIAITVLSDRRVGNDKKTSDKDT